MLGKEPISANAIFAPDPLRSHRGRIDPEAVETPELCKGLALWHTLRGARCYPSLQQMSPRALGALLRHTILIKVLDRENEFQVRIIGDAIMAVQTDPLQGLTTAQVDELLPGYGAGLRRMYSYVCATKAPIAFRGELRREADGRVFHREHLLVPLGDTDDAVDHLISFIVYIEPAH
jgi:hypothetical protein